MRIVNLDEERRRRRAHQPSLLEAANHLIGLKRDADQVLLLDSSDVVRRLAPVLAAVCAALETEHERDAR